MSFKYIVEADGGSRGNPGSAGSGAVVIDAQTGEVVAEIAKFVGIATNNVAEYIAMISGLAAAFEMDPGAKILVRMDSKLVVEQMSGTWKIKHPDMQQLAIEANQLIAGREVTFQWIPREENSRADALANKAMDEVADSSVFTTQEAKPQASVAEFNQAKPSSVRAPQKITKPLTTIYLVRHGRTALTESQRISGGNGDNPPLSALGRQDAESVASFVSKIGVSGPYSHLPKPDVVLSSPMHRAFETAEAVAKQLGHAVEKYPEFVEIHFGKWDGLTNDEAIALDPEHFFSWQGSWDVAPPEGESLDVFDARITSGLRRLLESNAGKTVVMVSHTMPVRGILRKALE
ncbi:MAG: bifunctional RNase H/acid phosphatase, partial [Actinomycetes bacterium]